MINTTVKFGLPIGNFIIVIFENFNGTICRTTIDYNQWG